MIGANYHTSDHNTEESQNHQGRQSNTPQGAGTTEQGVESKNNQLCHDVLTGKVLNPAPLQIPLGSVSVSAVFGATGDDRNSAYKLQNFANGFTLQYVYDDWYYADVTSDA